MGSSWLAWQYGSIWILMHFFFGSPMFTLMIFCWYLHQSSSTVYHYGSLVIRVCVCLSLSRCIKLHIYIHWGWSISLSQSIRLYHSLSFSCSISFIIYLEHPSPRISAGFGSQGTSFILHYIDCMALSLGLANCRNLLRGTGSTTSPQPGAWRAFVGECLGNPTVSWGPRVTRFDISIAMLT